MPMPMGSVVMLLADSSLAMVSSPHWIGWMMLLLPLRSECKHGGFCGCLRFGVDGVDGEVGEVVGGGGFAERDVRLDVEGGGGTDM